MSLPIQKLRLQKGWSQEDLAAVSGLSVRTIQRIERGQTASIETQKALAAAFGVELAQLKEPDMPSTPTDGLDAQEVLALKHVRQVRGFWMHLIQFVIVIALLAAVNLVLSPGYLWFLWVVFGWGIGIVSHAISVFFRPAFLGPEWERRQVERQLGRRL